MWYRSLLHVVAIQICLAFSIVFTTDKAEASGSTDVGLLTKFILSAVHEQTNRVELPRDCDTICDVEIANFDGSELLLVSADLDHLFTDDVTEQTVTVGYSFTEDEDDFETTTHTRYQGDLSSSLRVPVETSGVPKRLTLEIENFEDGSSVFIQNLEWNLTALAAPTDDTSGLFKQVSARDDHGYHGLIEFFPDEFEYDVNLRFPEDDLYFDLIFSELDDGTALDTQTVNVFYFYDEDERYRHQLFHRERGGRGAGEITETLNLHYSSEERLRSIRFQFINTYAGKEILNRTYTYYIRDNLCDERPEEDISRRCPDTPSDLLPDWEALDLTKEEMLYLSRNVWRIGQGSAGQIRPTMGVSEHAFCSDDEDATFKNSKVKNMRYTWLPCETHVDVEWDRPDLVVNGEANVLYFKQLDGSNYYNTYLGLERVIVAEFKLRDGTVIKESARMQDGEYRGIPVKGDQLSGTFLTGDNELYFTVKQQDLVEARFVTYLQTAGALEPQFHTTPAIFKFDPLCDHVTSAPECDYKHFRPTDIEFSDEKIKVFPEFDPNITEYKLDMTEADDGFFRTYFNFPELDHPHLRNDITSQYMEFKYIDTLGDVAQDFHNVGQSRQTEAVIPHNYTNRYEVTIGSYAAGKLVDEVTYTFRLWDWIKPPWVGNHTELEVSRAGYDQDDPKDWTKLVILCDVYLEGTSQFFDRCLDGNHSIEPWIQNAENGVPKIQIDGIIYDVNLDHPYHSSDPGESYNPSFGIDGWDQESVHTSDWALLTYKDYEEPQATAMSRMSKRSVPQRDAMDRVSDEERLAGDFAEQEDSIRRQIDALSSHIQSGLADEGLSMGDRTNKFRIKANEYARTGNLSVFSYKEATAAKDMLRWQQAANDNGQGRFTYSMMQGTGSADGKSMTHQEYNFNFQQQRDGSQNVTGSFSWQRDTSLTDNIVFGYLGGITLDDLDLEAGKSQMTGIKAGTQFDYQLNDDLNVYSRSLFTSVRNNLGLNYDTFEAHSDFELNMLNTVIGSSYKASLFDGDFTIDGQVGLTELIDDSVSFTARGYGATINRDISFSQGHLLSREVSAKYKRKLFADAPHTLSLEGSTRCTTGISCKSEIGASTTIYQFNGAASWDIAASNDNDAAKMNIKYTVKF